MVCNQNMSKRLFRLCWFTYMISCLGRFNYAAAMAELITRQGFSKGGAGLIGTALFAVYGVCQIATGLLGDRIKPRRMVAFGLFGSAAVNLAMGFASTQPVMLVLWMVNGVFQSCMWSPMARIFAEMLLEDERRRVGSNVAATIPVSTILIYLMAAVSIRFLSWRFVFWVPAVLMLVAALIWLPSMAKIEQQVMVCGVPQEIPKAVGKQGNLLQIIMSSGVLLIAVAALSHGLLKDGIQSWMPTFLTEQFGMSTYASTAVSLILPAFNICGVLLTRWLVLRFIRNELAGAAYFFGIALLSLGALAILGTGSSLLSIAALTVASTAMIGESIMLINLIPMHFGAIGRASTMTGILNCSAYAGSAISSFGVGTAVEHLGWAAAIVIWLAFASFALVATVVGRRRWGAYSAELSRGK